MSAFYRRSARRCSPTCSLEWGDTVVEETLPPPLPDLFAGQQIVLAGRYREGGPLAVPLEGTVNGETRRFRYDDLALARDGTSEDAWLPRLWATRKIGTLLQSIRQQGESREAVEEIIDLAIRYGIVTPYTTFLVDEGEDVLRGGGARRGGRAGAGSARHVGGSVSGATAVTASEAASEMAESDRAAALPTRGGSGEQRCQRTRRAVFAPSARRALCGARGAGSTRATSEGMAK